ncbi:hypothetical protein P0136_00435 [Lentisphaerota bacterium ZTH]|nr:hypothetical protein JYG24_08420 [Lentisphaerota bacterium]WET06481.1 hypothetical protein P0136_00435 [Lentisphaerota bacterium ZTH]
MDYEVHEVEISKEFKICPLCGYQDGFHTMIRKEAGKFKKLYICPRCSAVFDLKLK